MDLAANEIRKLRLRLGWSVAEMARQMGCSIEILLAWETGAQVPDPEALNQMRYLNHYADGYNDKIVQKPLAEREMEDRALAQLTHRDFSFKNTKN